MRDGGGSVVDVRGVGPTHIVLERLETSAPTAEGAHRFGAELATVHNSGARSFGCPPDGFDGQMFIGSRPMSSVEYSSWGAFYAAERVLPFLRVAVDAGNIAAREAADVERVCAAIADGVFDDDAREVDESVRGRRPGGAGPSRIHGDLWTGNVLWTVAGAVMIDPAAHGGHRETDLAMLQLFGCPMLTEIIDGYQSQQVLREGWRERIPLHQLHPLAVHAAGHGPSYGAELHRAAASVARLL